MHAHTRHTLLQQAPAVKMLCVRFESSNWAKKQHKLRTKVSLLQWQNSWFFSTLLLPFSFSSICRFLSADVFFSFENAMLLLMRSNWNRFALVTSFCCYCLPKYTWSLHSTRNGRRLPLILSCRNIQSSNRLCYNHVFVTTQINNAKMFFFLFFSDSVLVPTKRANLSLTLSDKEICTLSSPIQV